MSIDADSLAKAGFRMGDGGGAGGGAGGGGEEAAARRAEAEAARGQMLKSILSPEARERLNRVSMVKPDNARAVEDHVIRLARAGKLMEVIDESTLIRLLEEVSSAIAKQSGGGATKKVIIQRKRRDDDDDDDDDF